MSYSTVCFRRGGLCMPEELAVAGITMIMVRNIIRIMKHSAYAMQMFLAEETFMWAVSIINVR
jgi:hypothetical protein